MIGTWSSYRIDSAVENLLSDSGRWAVDGHDGQVLYHATGLRDAIDRAAAISAAGAPVVALRRDDMVVASDWIEHFQIGLSISAKLSRVARCHL
jgi:hypothetical protein